MNDSDEKVCLTAKQIENIGIAYAKNFPAPKKNEVCKKADKWVKGFFGKGKKKKDDDIKVFVATGNPVFDLQRPLIRIKRKKEPKDPVESWISRKIVSKIEGWADGFF